MTHVKKVYISNLSASFLDQELVGTSLVSYLSISLLLQRGSPPTLFEKMMFGERTGPSSRVGEQVRVTHGNKIMKVPGPWERFFRCNQIFVSIRKIRTKSSFPPCAPPALSASPIAVCLCLFLAVLCHHPFASCHFRASAEYFAQHSILQRGRFST